MNPTPVTSKPASSFAPYSPPPEQSSSTSTTSSTSRPAASSNRSPWFTPNPAQHNIQSYQAGHVPTFSGSAVSAEEERNVQQNPWETRIDVRVDVQAAFAYLFGPISALALLIIETENDYVRFHAYQAALLTMPLILLRILFSLLGFPSFFKNTLTLFIIVSQIYMAFRAHRDASDRGLTRLYLPYIGQIADKWVDEE